MKINPLEHPVCLSKPLRVIWTSAWLEHIPFGMFLVDLLRPRLMVELGTQSGLSYCAFCQAVKELNLETRCYAVDTWKGDLQTGFYDATALAELTDYHDPLYGRFSRLIQSTFDDAVKHFEDNSIDLLHIDGYHTYEIVKHDFETWQSKVSQRGVVIFHDINVRLSDYGVWRFWEEIKKEYPHFEMLHCNGLGVLSLAQHRNDEAGGLFSASDEEKLRLKEFFFILGAQITQNAKLSNQLQEQTTKNIDLQASLNEISRSKTYAAMRILRKLSFFIPQHSHRKK